eukprot:TRINITY_DN68272_c0_g1_i1.p2 TRINITY_DN68272_c0_g1~~TRINITY_DN68272_c0_g1_i1.p2  ORF type:complete len:198 (+),score=46.19 TRINITY_DN68272_c0_g1_i1:116-709(+)
MRAIFTLAALAASLSLTDALTLVLDAKSRECFTQNVDSNQATTVQFQVTSGGLLDIDATITGVDGHEVKAWTSATEGKFHYVAPSAGNVVVCFSNEQHRWNAKYISFFIINGHPAGAAKMEHLDPIERAIVDLSQAVHDLQSEQMFLRTVEHVHRETVEKTHDRILHWGFFELLVLLVMVGFQVYFLKRFLEIRDFV